MHVLSWNVNGLRAILKKDFNSWFEFNRPFIGCFQEVKARSDQVDLTSLNGINNYHQFWNPAKKDGYSGTLILSKPKPIDAWNGINNKEHDNEGRVTTLEFQKFLLINCYTPNSGVAEKRLPYRIEWDKAFLSYLQNLKAVKMKPIIFCGDLNVAHQPIDLARPIENERRSCYTQEERTAISNILNNGYIDSFREINGQAAGKYSYWSYRTSARDRNVGWRVDYICLDRTLREYLQDAYIMNHVMGSDHCPVGIKLDAKIFDE